MSFNLDQEWVSVFGHPPESAAEKTFFATMQKVVSAGQMGDAPLKIMLQNGAKEILEKQNASKSWPDGTDILAESFEGAEGSFIETFPMRQGGYAVRIVFTYNFKTRAEAREYGSKVAVALNQEA